jgi:autotransporter-associated beta strand protein
LNQAPGFDKLFQQLAPRSSRRQSALIQKPQPLLCALCVLCGYFLPFLASAQLTITNGVQTFNSLTNTTVTMTGRSELRLTTTTNPIPGCVINLNSSDAWLVLPGIKPSVVSASYLSQIFVNGVAASAGGNCRLDQYAMGSVIIPQSPSFTPLTVFTGPNFVGATAQFGLYTYYNTPAALGAMNRNFGSFKLKRGYSAAFAQNSDGTGVSKVFVAQDADLEVGVMDADLDHSCSFVRVIPWRWTTKKGYGGGDGATTIVEPQWYYDWSDGATSTPDREYLPMKWDESGNFNNINSKQKSTQVLGFNEPDSCTQANDSVADSLALWPSMLQSGMRVGAPAVSDSGLTGQGLDWLYKFMDEATNRGYRVDYIPIHWYKCGQSASSLSNYLYTVYQKYGRPIWLTEWNNGASWCQGGISLAQNATAISNFVTMLESAPFIERYAIYQWWDTTTGLRMTTTNSPSTLTPAGQFYHDKQSALAYTQTLPPGGGRSIAQFHFETNTLDSSGFGNNGFAQGIPGYVAGVTGQAVALDGAYSFLRLPPNIANSADFSFAGWVYWNGGPQWQRIFDFGNDTLHYLFLSPFSGGNTLRFAIRNGGAEQIVESPQLPAGQWTHVAVTLTGGTAKLYTNGVLAATVGGFTIVPSNFNPTLNYLGKSQFPDPLFNGALDEVQIADYAFTAAQIASLQTNSPPQFTTNLIAGGSATQGLPYNNSLTGAASDPDPGDTLTYSKASGPAWLAVTADGTLSGTPTVNDSGTNNFTIRAVDAAGASSFAVLAITLPASTATGTWSANADGNWSDTSKWTGSLTANGGGSTADFSTVAAGHTVTLDNSRSIGTLKFTQPWTLAASGGSVLTLESGSANPASILVNQNTATISAPLAGWNGFTKSGVGTLILSASNSLTGTVNIDTGNTTASDGIVKVTHPAALASASAIRFRNNTGTSAGSTLQLDGTAGSINLNAPIALNGRNAAVAAIQNLAGANSLTGEIDMNVGGGNYWIQSDAGSLTLAGLITPVATSGTRTLTFQGAGNHGVTGFIQNGCATVSLVKSGTGTLTLSGYNTYTGGTIVNGGTLFLTKGGSSGTIRNNLTINSGATVSLTATDALGYTNANSGITFVSSATLVGGTLNIGVNGNEGFNTKFTLTGATMSSSGGGAFNFDGASGAGVTTLASSTLSTISAPVDLRSAGVVFSVAAGSVPGGIDLNISGVIRDTGSLVKSGTGIMSLSGVNTYSGPTTISAGTLFISSTGRLGSGAYAASITNNGVFNYSGSLAQSLSGGISGTGGLTEAGPGTLTLSGANIYSGNTIISGGRLTLSSAVTLPNSPLIQIGPGAILDVSASGFTIGASQTLFGSGTVLGNLTNNGALTVGGTGSGTLICGSGVTLNSSGTTSLKLNKAAATNDQLRVTGALKYGGTLAVANLGGTLAAGDAFQVFTASSYSGAFTATNLPSLSSGLYWQWDPASGTASVLASVATNPTNLTFGVSGSTLQLTWPSDHTGWRLETNAVDLFNPAFWFTLPGSSATNQVFLPIDPSSTNVFFRLTYP